MGRLAGAVIALDHDAPVVGEAGQDRERGVVVEPVGVVHVGHMLGSAAEGRNLEVAVEAEGLPDGNLDVRDGAVRR